LAAVISVLQFARFAVDFRSDMQDSYTEWLAKGKRGRGSWPSARRYLFARVLRAPARHLALVRLSDSVFVASCVCGWQGAPHTHRGDAFADAHVHTRHVQSRVSAPDGEALSEPRQLAMRLFDPDAEATNQPWQLALGGGDEVEPGSDARAIRRSW
jgi:hypothetical protein